MAPEMQVWDRLALLEQQVANVEHNLRRMMSHAQVEWVDAAPSSGDHADVKALIAAGNQIGAIKLLRDQTGMGLKEAKQAVEQLEAER